MSRLLRLTVAPTRGHPLYLGIGRRSAAADPDGVVSACTGRPAVAFLVRLLLVAYRSVGRNEKLPLVLNHQLFLNSELAQVFTLLFNRQVLSGC